MLQNTRPHPIQGLILDPLTSNALQHESCSIAPSLPCLVAGFLEPLPVSPDLGPVAAIPHIAPAPAVVLGGVHKEPAAVVGRASVDVSTPAAGHQQVRRRAGDRRQHVVELFRVAAPMPREFFAMTAHSHPIETARQFAVQDGQVVFRRGAIVCQRQKNSVNSFA